MKKCTTCEQIYDQEAFGATLNYCLSDGTALIEIVDDLPPTIKIRNDSIPTIKIDPSSSRLPDVDSFISKIVIRRFTDDERFERLCREAVRQFEFGIIPATGVARALLVQEQYETALRVFSQPFIARFLNA